MALWIAAPLLVLAAIWAGIFAVHAHQKTAQMRTEALERLIPGQESALAEFKEFFGIFTSRPEGFSSLEDAYLARIDQAAAEAQFALSEVRMNVEPLRSPQPGTVRVQMNIRGAGQFYDVALFLNNIKRMDPAVFEKQVDLVPDGDGSGRITLSAELEKIYVPAEGRLR